MGDKKKRKTFNAVPPDLRYWNGYKYYMDPDTLVDENGPYIVNGETVVSTVGKDPVIGKNLPATISQYIFTDPTGKLDPDTLYVETPPYTSVLGISPNILYRVADTENGGEDYGILGNRFNTADSIVTEVVPAPKKKANKKWYEILFPSFFADGGKPSRLRPKKFQPGGDIEDEVNELPPYYNGTDTVPSTNATNNNKYNLFKASRKTTNDLIEEAKRKTPIKPYNEQILPFLMNQYLSLKERNLTAPKGILNVYKRGGNLAVKVDRGNGIEGYRSVSYNDVNWVRNADGRYVPLLKEFARGGMMRKFRPGGPVEDLGRGMNEKDSIAITRLQRIYEAAYNKYNGANDSILTPDEMYDELKKIHDNEVLLDTINAVNGRPDKNASREYMKNFKKLNSGK